MVLNCETSFKNYNDKKFETVDKVTAKQNNHNLAWSSTSVHSTDVQAGNAYPVTPGYSNDVPCTIYYVL